MTTCSRDLEHRRLRAPQENGGILVDPPLDRVASWVEENLARREGYRYDFQGRSLSDLARESRRQLLLEAWRYSSAYRDAGPCPTGDCALIFLAGHQPQLFHAGVWLKNFALDAMAREHGAVAVNLLIDSDTVKGTRLPIPGGSVVRPHVATIPLDRAGPRVPYEQRRILDRGLFGDFGRRVCAELAPLVPDPLLETYWPMAVERMRQTDNLGACLAQSRHQLEAQWGLTTYEIPQSRVCSMEPHRWFMAHLLAWLPRLWRIYNEVVNQYRRINRIRSQAHPVPNLVRDDPWLEAPFWIWSVDAPRRRRLFARQRGHETVLSDRHGQAIVLPLSPDADARRAVERLRELAQRGVRIRPRALLTTLWARLVLGDLFVHGIGGAKYDQLTDALISRFFRLQPPAFVVVSATLHLPVGPRRSAVEDARAIQRQLRELTYHPERYANGAVTVSASGSKTVADLIAAKAHWIRTAPTRENARTRCRQIRRINEMLQPYVAALRGRLLDECRRAAEALKAEAVLSCREYAFCLFPEKTLREFLLPLLHKSA
jgi:hypothetical protein